MHAHLVVIGSLNADFVFRSPRFPVPGETIIGTSFQMFPGGKGANQAYAAAKLGARVSMIGQVGNDAQGRELKRHLAAVGVDVAGVRRDKSTSSGIAAISINAEGQNHITIIPGANGTFNPAQLKRRRSLIASAQFVLLQLEIPLPTVLAAAKLARAAGAVVILDPAPAQMLPEELLSLADYVTPNETELAVLTNTRSASLSAAEAGRLGQQLRARGAKKVIAKLGAQGALLLTEDQESFWPAIPVQAVDTTAAGDAFNAAFASALAAGAAENEAGQFATAAAACSVTRPGAQPSMPTREEVETRLQDSGSKGLLVSE